MFQNRQINTKINNLHYRALRIIYMDETSSFKELLQKDGSVTIHQRNLQFLTLEMFKAKTGLAPSFMNEIQETRMLYRIMYLLTHVSGHISIIIQILKL